MFDRFRSMVLLVFAVVLALVCPRPVEASQTSSQMGNFGPGRGWRYTVSSGWVVPNPWEDGSCVANEQTYRMLIPVPQHDAIGLTYRMRLSYRYVGPVSVSTLAPCSVGVDSNSWQAYWLGHEPNQIGGQQWQNALIPIEEPAFNGHSAGSAGYFDVLWPGEQKHVDVIKFFAEQQDGGTLPNGALSAFIPIAQLDVDELVNGVPMHAIYFTPTQIYTYSWEWWGDGSAWTGTHYPVASGVRVLDRIDLTVEPVH